MERQPKRPEYLSSRERQKLIGRLATRAEELRAPLAAAPEGFREQFLPLLATGNMLVNDELSDPERVHLRKLLVINSDVLRVIPRGVTGVEGMQEFIGQEAGGEHEQWRQIVGSEKKPQSWKNAIKDADKLKTAISEIESK